MALMVFMAGLLLFVTGLGLLVVGMLPAGLGCRGTGEADHQREGNRIGQATVGVICSVHDVVSQDSVEEVGARRSSPPVLRSSAAPAAIKSSSAARYWPRTSIRLFCAVVMAGAPS